MAPTLDVHTRTDPSTPASPAAGDLDALLLAVAAGDQAAFSALYEATATRARGLAARLVGDATLAEEVTQDAFLHVWQQAGRFDPARGNARSWVLMIVRGQAVSRVRSEVARRGRECTFHAQGDLLRPVPRDTTYEVALAGIQAQLVRGALEHLTDLQRETLVLAFLHGHT